MRKKAEKRSRRARQRVCKLLLFVFAVLLFAGVFRQATATTAGVSTVLDIRVGLKNKFAGKQSITIYNTSLEAGYCDGREYSRETVLSSENGVTVTPEKGSFYAIDGVYTLAKAEALAEELTEAGARAYAVMSAPGKAGIYVTVAENGDTETEAIRTFETAAKKCNVTPIRTVQTSAYLIRLTAGDRVLFADGAEGYYPQFGATQRDEDGIYAVDLGDCSYRGRIEIGRYGGKSSLTAVNVVPIEEYLYGVVPCEMPASWNAEALKAQAVCARSYALIKAGYHAETDVKRGFRMVDTVQSQVYGGTTYEHARSNAAVDATKGETLCYENRTVTGYYCSGSGGHTENVEDVWGFAVPYLQGVPDIYETNPSKKPWSVTLSKDELKRLLRSGGKDVGAVKKVMQEVVTSSGRVTSLRIVGSLGSVGLATDTLRNVLELASTKFRVFDADSIPDQVTIQGASGTREAAIHDCYVINGDGTVQSADGLTKQYVVLSADNMTSFPRYAPEEGEYLFAGMGHGHGVGMSQSGANGMAEAGFDYKEILEHYFTGISVR
ncbi:MAG: SpoIID/LytB domain-containing protein [Lachnospiraceae bacterium]|nr:SpoIID/LytB domain-containing protein [Lachnospiraceae bacterium]